MATATISLMIATILFFNMPINVNSTCKSGDIRFGGQVESAEGLIEICDGKGSWNGVCGWSFDCDEAKVACRQGNHGDALSYNVKFPRIRKSTEFGLYECQGTESSLLNCPPDTFWTGHFDGCDSWRVSVKCADKNATDMCNVENMVRLVNGSSSSEGQLQICTGSRWKDVCSSDDNLYNLGSIACRQLGHKTTYITVSANGHYYGGPSSSRYYSKVDCDEPSHVNLSFCSKHSNCYSCSRQEVAVKCDHEITDCVNGSVRLVGGPSTLEGNVEMCLNGIWGGIVNNAEGKAAELICSSLGFSSKGSSVVTYNQYKRYHSPVLVDYINCCHNDEKIQDCQIDTVDGVSELSSINLLGVRCTDGCTDGQTRLTGGNSKAEGVVELCVQGLWTQVGLDRWDNLDAQVACKATGQNFTYAYPMAMNSTSFKRSQRSVTYTSFRCQGNEESLLKCSKYNNYRSEIRVVAAAKCGCSCDNEGSGEGRKKREAVSNVANKVTHKDENVADDQLGISKLGIFAGGSVFGLFISIGGILLTRFVVKQHKN